jgi:hypothetical protein
MLNHQNLIFFNKEGDALNFSYNESVDRFEGNILFHENSNDTFKTYGLYLFEKVPSFEFELPGELTTNKFQLFNEFGLHLYGAKYTKQQIVKIEPVNNDSDFYTKWVYGDDFHAKFPIGTIIKFDVPFLEFLDINKTYVVVGSKLGAIMIVTQMDNDTFETSYYGLYSNPNASLGVGLNNPPVSPTQSIFYDKTISGVNAVGVYDYIDNSYNNNLSSWNEPNFYDKYYVKKKLNIMNTDLQSGDDVSGPYYTPLVVTIDNPDLTDQTHFEYSVNKNNLPQDSELIIEVITRTDVPRVYTGPMTIENGNKIKIDFIPSYPQILKPGTEFKIIGSPNNTNFFSVSYIPEWSGIVNETYFATYSQVVYNNKIYECQLAYTQSFGSYSTQYVTPDDTTYWGNPNYIYVDQATSAEAVLQGQIYLTTDKYYYSYPFTQSAATTLASAAQKYNEDLKLFNIDLYYKKNKLHADLIYPSKYANVNFYHTSLGTTYSIGQTKQTVERLCGVKEQLNYELNYNTSENFEYNVVFTDLDEYGVKIYINGQVYEEEFAPVYSGSNLDMERTIDRTLRNWLGRNFIRLYTIGIRADLVYIGNYTSIFVNAIKFRTQYPNVPLELEQVLVGITANHYIEHSRILFNSGTYSMPYLSLTINGIEYSVPSIAASTNVTDVSATITSWVDTYYDELSSRGIIVTDINYLLKIDVKSVQNNLVYEVSNGRVTLPGLLDYTITNKIKGNVGMFITSNEVLLPSSSTASFEAAGFATGMLFSINNTVWPWDNQEYNIQFLDPQVMNLSYQGPFWGLTDSICNSSAFVTLAFNIGFGQTYCVVPTAPTGSGGEFYQFGFSSGFNLVYNPNTYYTNNYNLSSYPGTGNLVDIKYVQLSNSLYGFGDAVTVLDAYLTDYITTINLPGNTQSIKMEYNTVNNYLYCLSQQNIYVIDPLIDSLVGHISFTASTSFPDATCIGRDIQMNPVNGDVYLTYRNRARVDIWSVSNFTNNRTAFLDNTTTNFPSGVTSTGKMVFNDFEQDMYITTESPLGYVMRVNSNRTIQTNYNIPGLTHSLFYEPVNESIYVYGSSNLWQIDNGITQSISINTGGFNDVIFNNFLGEMNISDSSPTFTRLDLATDTPTQFAPFTDYGFLGLSQYDGDIYMTGQIFNQIVVCRPQVPLFSNITLSAPATKIVYNPERKSMWVIQPSINSMTEVEVTINNVINILPVTYSQFEDGQYGTLDPNYEARPDMWLKTREFIRRPRENYEGDVSVDYYWRWYDDTRPEFFFYDFSGDQLPITGSYAYTGPKPLPQGVLNKKANTNLDLVSDPAHQQTIFSKVTKTLSYIDDSDDISTEPTPLELFIGFKAEEEGPVGSILQLVKKEAITTVIDSDSNTTIYMDTVIIDGVRRGILSIDNASSEFFTGRGLKPQQIIEINLYDLTNSENQYVSENHNSIFIIKDVYSKSLVLDFVLATDTLFTDQTAISNYPSTGLTTYLRMQIKVKDREIARLIAYGQTEEEDERFKIELGNVGKLINPDEVFIFKEYDILEGGIDWTVLNRKRKEMLMMKHLIYPYIGAYKSIINAINYFGYNDLQLNEYYRNINQTSPEFLKLFKVEIPDIFDNTVEGWTENDYIKNTYPNENYEETNLFNLTYFITDKEGNITLNYTIDEVIIKLQGLKYWLKKNIIPLTHNILDITGKTYFTQGTSILHKMVDVQNIKIKDEMTPVTFKLNESYLMPVNSGSTVYNCVLDFYSIIPDVGAEIIPTRYGLKEKPKAYYDSTLTLPDTFDIKIRTYKTYKEWAPFVTYNTGDKVTYYGKLYESVIDSNRVKSPRRFENTAAWSANNTYQPATTVNYDRDIFVFSGLGSTQSTVSPNLDTANWLKITEWKQIDFEPVQTIAEFREGTNLLPFNFTIDSNIDPFLVIEVTSDNGYGEIFRDRKNYEIRGLKDLQEPYQFIDPIGPFVPITPVY